MLEPLHDHENILNIRESGEPDRAEERESDRGCGSARRVRRSSDCEAMILRRLRLVLSVF
eukprot:897787-Rhodomonas_salina.2